MRQITLTSIENQNEVYDFVNSEVSTLTETTVFKHEQKYNQLNLNDYAVLEEDDTFTPQNLTFKTIIHHGELEKFKSFIRRNNKNYIMKIWVPGFESDTKFVLVKKLSEEIQQMAATNLDRITMTFITQTNFIKLKHVNIALVDTANDPGSFANSNHDYKTDDYFYSNSAHDDSEQRFVYGSTKNTISDFTASLPKNDGDKKAYLKFTISNFEDNPQYGLGAHAEFTDRAYISSENGAVSELYNIVNDSFAPFKKIILVEKGDVEGINAINIEFKRDFSKDSYLTLEPGEKTKLYMRSIYNISVTIYEQYVNL